VADAARRTLGAALSALLLLAAVPFGGRLLSAWPLLAAGAAVLGFCALVCLDAQRRQAGRVPSVPAAGPLAVILTLLIVTMIPLPALFVRLLSPASLAVREAALGGAVSAAPLSVAPAATLSAAGRAGAAAAVFLGAWVVASAAGGSRRILALIAASGTMQAVLGLISFLEGRNRVLGYTRDVWEGRLSGTYINPNHFAGLMELAIPAAVGLLLVSAPSETGARRRASARFAAALSDRRFAVRLLLAACALLMAFALLLSASRAGIALSALAVAALLLAARRAAARRGRLLAAALLVGLAALPAAWGVLGREAAGFARTSEDLVAGEARLGVWTRASAIFRDHPWVGSGLGSFATTFPRYRGPGITMRWEELHNDPLQWVIETGIAGTALALIALAGALAAARHGFAQAPGPADAGGDSPPGLRLAALCGLGALALHESFDFNLQIPANAFMAAAVLAVVLAPSGRSVPRSLAGDEASPRRNWLATAAAGLLAASLSLSSALLPLDRSLAALGDARETLSAAENALSYPLVEPPGLPPLRGLSAAGSLLHASVSWNPALADAHVLLARVARLQGSLGIPPEDPLDPEDRLALAARFDPWRSDLRAAILHEHVALADLDAALEDLRALAARGGGAFAEALPVVLAAAPDEEVVEGVLTEGARARGEIGEGAGWSDARLLYADGLLTLGRSDDARAWLRSLIGEPDAPAHILSGAYGRLTNLIPDGEAVQTAALGDALLDRMPDAAPSEAGSLRAAVARARLRAGDPCRASSAADQALALLPSQPGVRLLAADCALACGHPDVAAREFEFLLRGGADAAFLAAAEPQARRGLAQAYEALGRRQDALDEWRTVVRLTPGDASARERVLMLESGL